jgi:hypothetical protein
MIPVAGWSVNEIAHTEDCYGISVAINEPPLSRNAAHVGRLRASLPGDPIHWRLVRLLLDPEDDSSDASTWVEVRSGGTITPGNAALRPYGSVKCTVTTFYALLMTTGAFAAEQCPSDASAQPAPEWSFLLMLAVAAVAFICVLAGFAISFCAGYFVGRRAYLPVAVPPAAPAAEPAAHPLPLAHGEAMVPPVMPEPPMAIPADAPQQDIPVAIQEMVLPEANGVFAGIPQEEAFFNEGLIQRQYTADLQSGMPGRIAYAKACGACARRKIVTGRVIGVALIARTPVMEVGPVWRVRNRYWVVLRDNAGVERVRVFTRWFACFPVVCSRNVADPAVPLAANHRGAEHLDPGSVFHAWSTLDEVRAYVEGVNLPAFFYWDGILEGPRD